MGPWVLLVTHDLRTLGTRSRVATTSCDDDVDDLKTKVKEKRKVDLAQVDVNRLTVWKLKGENIINKLNFSIKRLAEILGSIDIDDVGTIEELDSGVKEAGIGLPSDETLLVQMPAVALDEDHPLRLGVGDPVTFKVDRAYEDCFLQARTEGGFEEDITRNDIEDAHGGMLPDFIMTYEETLCRKPKVDGDGSEILATAEPFVGKVAWERYFECRTTSQAENFPANKWEITHLIHISSVDVANSWDVLQEGRGRRFKEGDGNWLMFYAIAHHCRSLRSNVASDGTLKISVKLSQESWPFSLITQVASGDYYTYRPRSGFLVLRFGLPRVAVEVNSNLPDRPTVDLYRLMLQAASIVRFAKSFINVYKQKKSFIFVAIFISHTRLADRYLLYQRGDSRMVWRKQRRFRPSEEDDRVEFALELYNLVSVLENESENDDTHRRVKELIDVGKPSLRLGEARGMLAFTGKTLGKRPANDNGGNQPQAGPSTRRRGGAAEQPEAHKALH
ncbi:hypothetical protein EDB92DRAFT_1948697 [Lactarius akahatsu]|uniref:Uncharacterized protein n=1 Tax=Lactarius akahatsu TaxID=416441 RepID=A0AAD4LAW5_9AGAM|nr:hypothetical protein EDB92DRAFT_1948697 [Lactarius akahatsu]